jgi:aryl-alcohol dehydrogenase-like predicted oxidoreductase
MVDHRPLGDSGLVVSVVGIGCNAFGTRIDQDTVDDIVDSALEAGVNFFDTADTYGRGLSEEMLGRALQGRRQDVVLATKFGMDMDGANGPDHGARASRRYVRRAVEASLRRLQTDHIDLYQLHQPDLVTPIEETLSALGELVTEGKVRYVGCSNFAAWEVADAHHVARALNVPGFITAQNEYSLYNRVAEDELLPACQAMGLSVLPYFPLAYGLLTGKYKRDQEAPAGSSSSSATRL